MNEEEKIAEMVEKLDAILDEYKGENAKYIGMILVETALYLLDNYDITKENMIKSLENSINIIEKEGE